jgi:hypothetical protein
VVVVQSRPLLIVILLWGKVWKRRYAGQSPRSILCAARMVASLAFLVCWICKCQALQALCAFTEKRFGELLDGDGILPHVLTKRRAAREIRCRLCLL